ncbi:MAG: GDP-mannose 4,6-dehydratase, partial [Candidatus Gracilibacteria bacterium]|nr:GDP-mannose 4,6-dehydratase [Candidatus Gracilibacteria bacterium]
IIFSSSATVYKELKTKNGESRGCLETDEIGDCSNPYGTSKYLIEQVLLDLSKFAGFKVMNLRYFNPIGAHESGFIGEDPNGLPNNLLPYVMKVSTGEFEFVRVFGNDYETIDGTGVRDYIDVCDLIDGHLKAYEKISKKSFPQVEKRLREGFFETYNLGTGKGVSVLEIIEAVKKTTGKEIPYKILDRRAGDLAEVYCNPEKALKELSWKTKISLEESIKNMWKFYNK